MAGGSSKPPGTDKRFDSAVKERDETKVPKRHKVLFHNDDYTPMEFVVAVLETLFSKSPAEARRIMILVHTSGKGIAGVYPASVAESKAHRTIQLARESGYPLLATTEPE